MRSLPEIAKLEMKWEHEFHAEMLADPNMQAFVTNVRIGPNVIHDILSEEEVLKYVAEDRLHGFLEVDIEIDPSDYRTFCRFPPLFTCKEIDREDLDDKQHASAEQHSLLTKPQRYLFQSLCEKNLVVNSTLLRWYLSKGLKVTKVHQIVSFSRVLPFKAWLDQLVSQRRYAVEHNMPILDFIAKSLGNSYANFLFN